MVSEIRNPQAIAPLTNDDVKRQMQGVAGDRAKLEKEQDKQFDGALKMFLSAAKNKMPGDDSNSTEEILRFVTGLNQMTTSRTMVRSMQDLVDAHQQNKVMKYQNMIDQRVQVNNSTHTYNGHPINFSYQLDFEKGKLPSGAMVSTAVTISDEKGRKVYEGTGKTTPGEHEFVWDGYDLRGQEAPQGGAYTITVNSGYNYFQDGMELHGDIHAHSTTEGVIEQVLSEGSSVMVMVDGKKVDSDNIVTVMGSSKKGEAQTLQRMTTEQAAVLLDKTIEVSPNKVELSAGEGVVHFLSGTKGGRTDVKVEFYDSTGKQVSVAQHQVPQLKEGMNSFAWSGDEARSLEELQRARATYSALPKLDDDVYSYTVYVMDVDGEYKLLDNKVSNAVVTAIEPDATGNAKLNCGGELYDSAWVSKVMPAAAAAAPADQWVQQGQSYVGHVCRFDKRVEYSGVGNQDITFDIPLLDNAAQNYTSARVMITDKDGNVVNTLDIPQDKLLSHLPVFGDLTAASQAALNTEIENAGIRKGDGTHLKTHGLLYNEGAPYSNTADNVMAAMLRNGNLQTTAQQHAGTAAHPYNRVTWDGMSGTGDAMPEGTYFVKVSYNVNGDQQGVISTAAEQVIFFDKDDEGIRLHTAGGHVIRMDEVQGIAS